MSRYQMQGKLFATIGRGLEILPRREEKKHQHGPVLEVSEAILRKGTHGPGLNLPTRKEI